MVITTGPDFWCIGGPSMELTKDIRRTLHRKHRKVLGMRFRTEAAAGKALKKITVKDRKHFDVTEGCDVFF